MLYTRTDGLPQPVATSDLLNLFLLENGNLEVRMPGPEARKELAEIRAKAHTFENVWRELFTQSDFRDSSWYICQSFALSSAPNICYGSIYDDDESDEPSDFEHIWVFEDYWKTDEFELLAEGRSVIFTAVPADKEPNEFCHDDEDGGQFIKKMVDSYLETALWTEEFDEQTIFDFSPESRVRAEKDCRAFVTEADAREYEPEKVGHDFWLSRNGHGSGFFDAEYLNEDLATWWQKLAQKAGKCGVSIVDGRAYLESE